MDVIAGREIAAQNRCAVFVEQLARIRFEFSAAGRNDRARFADDGRIACVAIFCGKKRQRSCNAKNDRKPDNDPDFSIWRSAISRHRTDPFPDGANAAHAVCRRMALLPSGNRPDRCGVPMHVSERQARSQSIRRPCGFMGWQKARSVLREVGFEIVVDAAPD